jgi:acetolactate synthase I/II/III large subunit
MTDEPGQRRLRYGSDFVVDQLKELGIEYVALNPGASFRGLHDSLVQDSAAPEMIVCTHEKVAVNLAHGYAKVTGRPMAAVLHDVVGLLHGSLGIFYAFTDRAPVMVLGGSGPMDASRRRPEIDWKHTANIQGSAVRDFTKWDDQPASVDAIGEALYRAHRIAVQEPAGPTYVAIDADLQERPLVHEPAIPSPARLGLAGLIGPEPAQLEAAAGALAAAERPLILAGYAGRDPTAFEQIPQLAELVGAGIVDTGVRLNAPTDHSLNVTGSNLIDEADLVLLLDMKDPSKALRRTDSIARTSGLRLRPDCRVIEIGFNDLQASAWVHHHGPLEEADIRVTADTKVALPLLISRMQQLVDGSSSREGWRERCRQAHDSVRSSWRSTADGEAAASPIAPSHLAAATWQAVRSHDWVLTAGTALDWALRLWDFDRPYRHAGTSLGTATQIGISLGVALAHRGSGRLVIDLQPDGDLLYDPGALWTAAAQPIPLLVVMYNNRAYYNDWNHQIAIARDRQRPEARAHVGVAIDEPAPDFAALARSFGWFAEGPVLDPDAIEPAVRRSADVVLEQGRPALVDVACRHR